MEVLNTQQYDNSGDGYEIFESLIDQCSRAYSDAVIFKTDVDPYALWEAYLDNMPANARQHYNCNACKAFVVKYGGLKMYYCGKFIPLFWNFKHPNALFFQKSERVMFDLVLKSKITSQFFSNEATWGTPSSVDYNRNKTWTHLSCDNNFARTKANGHKTAYQLMAESKEKYKMLMRAMGEYKEKEVQVAAEIIGDFFGGEKIVAMAQWLLDLYSIRKNRDLVWLKIAEAPDGWCHVKSSVLGTVLDDIRNSVHIDEIKRKFEEKTDPLKYQRPQSSPSDANIEQAEKIIKQLGIAESLKRRFATVDEIEKVWEPRFVKEEKNSGVFGHLKKKEKIDIGTSSTVKNITFEKFLRDVAPGAEKMWYIAPYSDSIGAFCAPVNSDAPNIMKWNNAYSWFVRMGRNMWGNNIPISVSEFNIRSNVKTEIRAISFIPAMWGDSPHPAFKDQALIALDGAHDMSRQTNACLFPETLINDLHSIRKTIKAYSASNKLEQCEGQPACGIIIGKNGMTKGARIVVQSNSVDKTYFIDRWE